MIRRIAHLCFNTDQLEKMKQFYSETLKLPVKITFKTSDDEIFGYYFDCGDSSFIEVFDRVLKHKQWGGSPENLVTGNQYAHFCFEVTALADLKATLESRGVKVTEIRTGMDNSLQAWTSDPDGNAIELMEYTSRSLQIQPGHSTT
ncbi:MAG TPA: VOC family protein [Capsulimonadaceae bacterium]|jgi:catechol 2,3-dioxygenase-like lactoylglutathione lyase family enzyme